MQFTSPLRAVHRLAVASLFVAGGAASASAQVPTALDFIGTNANVSVRFVGFSATDRSILAYQIGAINGFNAAGTWTDTFINTGSGATPLALEFNIGNVTSAQSVFFRLTNTTLGVGPTFTNYRFFNGPASRNPDNILHMALSAGSGTASMFGGNYTQAFSFEDRSATVVPITDLDYNDLRFEIANVAVIPEPSTYMLMGAGLLGLAGVARRRRSNS